MAAGDPRSGGFLSRLDVRVLLLLSLALLPLGIVAGFQTARVMDNIRIQDERNRLALTVDAAKVESELIERGFGATRAIASMIDLVRDDPDTCRRHLLDFVERSEVYSYVGYIDADGMITCASDGPALDVSGRSTYQRMREQPERMVRLTPDASVSLTTVISISQPVLRGTAFDGYVSLSLPHFSIRMRERGQKTFDTAELLTFNADGDVLTSSTENVDVAGLLPEDETLMEYARGQPRAFTARDRDGVRRVYAVAPVVEDLVYALGIWRPDNLAITTLRISSFPALMWLASLAVGYFAIHRLVIRHIRTLQLRMRRFAAGQLAGTRTPELEGASLEFDEMEETFNSMTDRIIRDQADLENMIHERGVLLKEVHHRVKNNLQLIVSIINMQIRKARAPEAKGALRRVQERVMGLATIHRNLYQVESLGRIRVDVLLNDIVNQLSALSADPGLPLRISASFAPATLSPDQAVPLSMFMSEALTNAIKYVGAPQGEEPTIVVTLALAGEDEIELTVVNTMGPKPTATDADDAVDLGSTGMGRQLVAAFAHQLDGEITREETETQYLVRMRFRIRKFEPEPVGDVPSDAETQVAPETDNQAAGRQ